MQLYKSMERSQMERIESKARKGMDDRQTSEKILQLVSFKLANEEFGFDILDVQEINRLMDITKLPESPDFVDGIINLRGRIVPIVNMRKRFGLGNQEYDKDSRVVVVAIDGKTIGLVVDCVSEVIRVPHGVVEPPPSMALGIQKEYISGVAKLDNRLLILLDLKRIFSQQEMTLLKGAA